MSLSFNPSYKMTPIISWHEFQLNHMMKHNFGVVSILSLICVIFPVAGFVLKNELDYLNFHTSLAINLIKIEPHAEICKLIYNIDKLLIYPSSKKHNLQFDMIKYHIKRDLFFFSSVFEIYLFCICIWMLLKTTSSSCLWSWCMTKKRCNHTKIEEIFVEAFVSHKER